MGVFHVNVEEFILNSVFTTYPEQILLPNTFPHSHFGAMVKLIT